MTTSDEVLNECTRLLSEATLALQAGDLNKVTEQLAIYTQLQPMELNRQQQQRLLTQHHEVVQQLCHKQQEIAQTLEQLTRQKLNYAYQAV